MSNQLDLYNAVVMYREQRRPTVKQLSIVSYFPVADVVRECQLNMEYITGTGKPQDTGTEDSSIEGIV